MEPVLVISPVGAPHILEQRAHDLGAQRRRRVAAVEEAVYGDGRHLEPYPELDAGQQVPVERVHAAGAQEADEVQRTAGLPEVRPQLHQGPELVEPAGADALGDAHEVLRHHAAGAEVQVADLAVAHLPLGEPDPEPAGREQCPRHRRPQPMPHGRVGQLDRVALAPFPVAPAVQDDEHDPAAPASV